MWATLPSVDLEHVQRPRLVAAPGAPAGTARTPGCPLASTARAPASRGSPPPGPSIQVRDVVRLRAATSRTAACAGSRPRAAAGPARRCRSARRRRRSGRAVRGRRRPAARAPARPPGSARVARARCSALFTDADRGVEQLGHLVGLPAQHLAQDQDGALPRRQVLQRGDERQPDRLPRDRPLGRIGVLRHHLPVEHRLDPRRARPAAGQRVLHRRVRRAGQVHRQRPPLPAGQLVEADVGGDPVQPGAQRRPALEVGQPAPGAHHRLLHRVLGVEGRPEHPVAVAGQLAAVLEQPRIELIRRGRSPRWSRETTPLRRCGASAHHRATDSSGAPTRSPGPCGDRDSDR